MPPSTLFRAARPALNFQFRSTASANSRTFTQQFARSTFRSSFKQQKTGGKRWQSTTAAAGEQVSWFKRMWDSPIGLKTVHFWAPVMKWCLVIAGISDFYRPVEKLSLTQNAALTATGAIWTRWCLIIKPRNVLLAAVNFFLGVVGIIQVTRIVTHNMSVKNESPKEALEEAKDNVVETAKGVKSDVVDAIKKA
ncbi:putative mitochondrial pyruvate carrier [Lachnellula subtilissima]|uniref:Mitochondrial pyruvate carrier n=1 Tax=Lachnellula subtilissima TaxID=602034 RepID=A0A8H8RDU1_9HELO|nr:putative mitochondrial pyruvate carrier [Lachnellula subtilissima]